MVFNPYSCFNKFQSFKEPYCNTFWIKWILCWSKSNPFKSTSQNRNWEKSSTVISLDITNSINWYKFTKFIETLSLFSKQVCIKKLTITRFDRCPRPDCSGSLVQPKTWGCGRAKATAGSSWHNLTTTVFGQQARAKSGKSVLKKSYRIFDLFLKMGV